MVDLRRGMMVASVGRDDSQGIDKHTHLVSMKTHPSDTLNGTITDHVGMGEVALSGDFSCFHELDANGF